MHRALVDIRENIPDHNISRWVTITEICCLSSSQSDWNCRVFTCLTWYVHNLRHTYLYRWMVSKECPQTWTMSVINKLSQMKHSDRRVNKTYSVWNRIPCRLQAQKEERVNISSDAFSCTILNYKQCQVLSNFFIYQLMHKRIALKGILKFTLKQLLHVPAQSPSSGSALFELAKVTVVKIIH